MREWRWKSRRIPDLFTCPKGGDLLGELGSTEQLNILRDWFANKEEKRDLRVEEELAHLIIF